MGRFFCEFWLFSRENRPKSADCSANFDFFPAKILRNRPIFPRICPWKSLEILLFFREISEALAQVHVRVTCITALKRTYLCHNTTRDHQQWTDGNDDKSKLPAIHKTHYKTHKNYCDSLKEHANFCTNTIIYFVQISVQKQNKWKWKCYLIINKCKKNYNNISSFFINS